MDEKAYQVLSQMPEAEWTKIILRLGRYALRASRNLHWRTENTQQLPGGETVESIVSKAIEKLFSGKRNWNPDADPSLEKYLMDVIDSLLNHLAESDDNTKFTIIPERYDEDGNPLPDIQAGQTEIGAEWLAPACQTPEAKLLEEERARRDEQVVCALIDECADDPVLKKVLEAMVDGCDNPRSIAEKAGLTRTDVYNANKRLDTKIASLRKRLSLGTTLPATKGEQNV